MGSFIRSYDQESTDGRLHKRRPVKRRISARDRTELFLAVFHDNIEEVKELLISGANPNSVEDILHIAVSKGSIEMVKLLIDHRVHIDRKLSKNGKTALYMAVETNQTEMARFLLYHGANVCLSTLEGRTLLHMSLVNKNETLSLYLAQSIPPANIDVVYRGVTALHQAVQKRFIRVARELINKGAQVNQMSCEPTGKYITSPLHIAVKNGDLDMVELLVRNGAKSMINFDGMSLHYAIYLKHKEIARLLLARGAAKATDYNIDGYTALHVAALSNQLDMAKLCIDYKANVNALCSIHQLTPLYYATSRGNLQMVKLLLENGARVDMWNCSCSTLLDQAITGKHEAIAKMLIEKGAFTTWLLTRKFEQERGIRMVIKILAQIIFGNPDMLKVVQANWEALQKSEKHMKYYELCTKELSKMRDHKIFNNVTFYDLMYKNENKMAAFGRNKEFDVGFRKSGFQRMFPIYSSVLSLKHAEARVRGALLRTAEDGFEGLGRYRVPALCAQMVVEYLENDDLKNFIKGTSHEGEDTGKAETNNVCSKGKK